MGLNPSRDSNTTDWKDNNAIGLEGAVVKRTNSHTEGDTVKHVVYVLPDTMDKTVPADVGINQTGDVQIPNEGSRVMIGYRPNERPFVLAQRYKKSDTIPDFEPGERIIGHPLSDSYVKLAADGSVKVFADNNVVINDGQTKAITDVSAASTNSDGGITSLNIERSDSVFIPSP